MALWLGCALAGPTEVKTDPGDGPVPWTSLAVRDAPEDFRFVLVSDRTGGHRGEIFEEALEKVDLLGPAFVLSVGDLIEGYTEDPAALDAMWDEVEGFVAALDAPFFYAPGNHDFSNETMAREWRTRFGPSFYHFRYKEVLFLVLNSELFSSATHPGHPVPGPDTQAAQLRYAERVLDEHRDARWTIVVVHQPLWDRREVPADWLTLEGWLGERPYTVFAGHVHRYTKEVRRDRRYVTLGTTGGRSQLRGLDQGEFDHVALVTMTAEGPVLANLLVDGIHDEEVRTLAVRDLVKQLTRALSVEAFLADDGFTRGSARFTVENAGERPLEVEARVRPGRDLVVVPAATARVLAAGESGSFVLDVEAREPLPVGAVAPTEVQWTLRGEKPDGSPLEVEQRAWVIPEKRFACARRSEPVVVDGALDEWRSLPLAIEARPLPPGSPEGASIRFGVAYDEEFLYLAARVEDPSPFFSAERVASRQDAVVVELDARPEAERAENEGFLAAVRSGAVAKLAFAWLTPGEVSEDPALAALIPDLPPETRHAARRTPSGYDAELAIPVAFLEERQGGAWEGFRLNLSVQDFDRDGVRHVTHWWRPSRFGLTGAVPAPGSGSFVRR
jgi:hypothetical protein